MSRIRSIDELMNDESDKSANVKIKEDKYSFEALEDGRAKRIENEKKSFALSDELKQIYNCLDDKFIHIDIIIEQTGLASSKVTSGLTQLEILGLIQSTSGKRYKKS